jgi:hypothetical protein
MKAVSVSLSVLFAVAAFASTAAAEHDDVIVVKVHENCSLQDYVKIKDDFNATWAKEHGYQAEVSVPLQATELTTVFWVGRSANAAAFGKAWDAWRDAQSDPKSTAAKLQARFDECSTNISRSGFDVY